MQLQDVLRYFAPKNKHVIVYLVCLWTSPATKSDSSELSALSIFVGTVAFSRSLVARAEGFY